jgi:MFS family permease
MATLGCEITAARLMAPYFGPSTIVWANTIAVVLVAVSIGYWVGGRLADRYPHPRGLHPLVLAAAAILGLAPVVARPFLALSVEAFDAFSVGAFGGALVGVLALIAAPILLLGAASPSAIRLELATLE